MVGSYNGGYENEREVHSDANNVRTHILHFHASFILCDSGSACILKNGAAPTMCLTLFLLDNENYEEDENFSRIVGSLEDTQHVYEHVDKRKTDNNSEALSMMPPTRYSRNSKRSFEFLQLEESKNRRRQKQACMKKILNMPQLCMFLNKNCTDWGACCQIINKYAS